MISSDNIAIENNKITQTSNNNDNNNNNEQLVVALRQKLKLLNTQRESIENESEVIILELTSHNPEQPNILPMGIDTPLVDKDGYPRNDIDIYHTRTLRQRLQILRNDHKVLMNEIHILLQQLAILQKQKQQSTIEKEKEEEEARRKKKSPPEYDPITKKWFVRSWDGSIVGNNNNNNTSSSSTTTTTEIEQLLPTATTITSVSSNITNENTNHSMDIEQKVPERSTPTTTIEKQTMIVHKAAISITDVNSTNNSIQPFARVESVMIDSPAYKAGLQSNDMIISFGPIINIFDTESITQLVQQSATNHEMIEIICTRRNTNDNNDQSTIVLLLQLLPRPWSGRGFLGCHIVPC